MTSAQAPGGAFVLGHSAAASPPPPAPGQRTQNVLVHPWLARGEGLADAFVWETPRVLQLLFSLQLDTLADGFPVPSDSHRNLLRWKREFSLRYFIW